MRKNMALVQLFIFFLLMGTTAFGGEMSKNKTGLNAEEKKSYNITFGSVLTSSLHELDSNDHQLSNEFSISPTFDLGQGYTLFSSIAGTKDLKGERKFYMGDGSVGVSTTLRKFGDLTITGTSAVAIPLSEGSKDIQTLRTSISLIPSFKYSVNKSIKLSYTPSAKLNIHEFKTSLTGSSNTQYQLGNTAAFVFTGLDWVTAVATATYLRKFTYRGNTSDVYAFSQSLSFTPTPATSISVGHAIGANPLQPNGIEQEIKVFDERKSSVFTGFSFTY